MTRFDQRDAVLSDLTAVRGLLALWVFAYHANLHLQFAGFGSLIGRGYLGVDGFFILSGLVLAHRHPNPSQTFAAYGGFWWRRLVRLYPTAVAMLLLLAAGLMVARFGGVRPHDAYRADGHEFTLQLLMLNGWGFSHGWTWNYPSWSISTEWAGYLLFPLLAVIVSRCDGPAVALGSVAMGVALLLLSSLSAPGLNLTYQGALLRFFPEFFGGILLARQLRLGLPWPLWLMAAIGIGVLSLGIWLRAMTTAGDAVTTIGLWLIIGTLAAGQQRVFGRLPALLTLGAISYPFYMAYAPVELIFSRAWGHWHLDPTRWPYLWLMPMFACVLALSWVTARLVERPALRYLAGHHQDR
ncbi:acyltransferase family protein [Acidisoma sp.]|uniref:acyltransferase family protein n=1 Tax=Acidisoma sp. TaxID=1872115 RepID=UPI003AFFB238